MLDVPCWPFLTAMPASPPTVFAPPSVPTPSAPGAVHVAPSASPSAPGGIHVVPSPGGGVDILTITGALTSDGTTPRTFPGLLYAGDANGRPSYTNDGVTSGATHVCYYEDSPATWVLLKVSSPYASWVGDPTRATPDLVPMWSATGINTGFPDVTLTAGGLPTPPAIHAAPSATPGTPPTITT